jgi:hypothetical protein
MRRLAHVGSEQTAGGAVVKTTGKQGEDDIEMEDILAPKVPRPPSPELSVVPAGDGRGDG